MTAPTPESHHLKGNRTATKLQYDKHSFAFPSKRFETLRYQHTGQAGLRMERIICCCLIHKADRIAMAKQQTVTLLWVHAAAAQNVGAQDQFKSGHKIQFIKITF